MRPTFVLTRTFVIYGFLVGAASLVHAAPVPNPASPGSEVEVQSRSPLFPIAFSNAIAALTEALKKREPFIPSCVFSCRRDPEHELEEKREPSPLDEPKPSTDYLGPCNAGCTREDEEEAIEEVVTEEKREPVAEPEPAPYIGACKFGCLRDHVEEKREPLPEAKPEPEPYMGACIFGCHRRDVDGRKDTLDEAIRFSKANVHAPLDVLARERDA